MLLLGKVHTLRRVQRLPAPPEAVFPFFGDAGNLEAITPEFLRFRIVTERPIAMHPGAFIEYRLRLHGIPIRWVTEIREWEPGVRFVDGQVKGPYAIWHHTHDFAPDGEGGTVMTDTVRYALPGGPLGELARRLVVGRDLETIFDFRRDAVARGVGAAVT